MRRTLYHLGILFTLSVLLVAGLFFTSEDLVHGRNSFYRQFPPHTLDVGDTLDVRFNSYYIAGATDHRVYLGNATSPFHVLVVDLASQDTQHVFIRALDYRDLAFWALRVKVDSPYFYLADGAVPVVFRGSVNDWVGENLAYDSAYFNDFQPMSKDLLAIRSLSSETKEYVLGTERLDRNQVRLSPGVLEKQIDGRFCVDGMLNFDKHSGRLVYVYFYRNQFIVTDTTLDLLYRGKTIDTVSHAQLQIASVARKGRTLSAPPLFVNKYSRVRGSQLVINSGLLSRNEDRRAFDQSSVLDVYDLNQGDYKFSLYIPEFNDSRLHDLYLTQDKLVVLLDHYLITYRLNRRYFP